MAETKNEKEVQEKIVEEKQNEASKTIEQILEEDDDDFEEFEVDDWENDQEKVIDIKQWQEDWDDDNDQDDEFTQNLRAELNL